MEKAYEPQKYEADIYARWEESGAFAPDMNAQGDPFCIIMPPPNANGDLHTGHAMYTVEDIMVRHARMQGRPTLWLPGSDHAGIETQVVFERKLAEAGKDRFDFGRQGFYDAVMKFTLKNKGTMESQIRSLGFSVDWSRAKFTLDQDIIDVVYKTFKQLLDDGLIYRGNRIVNWCPRCQSSFADIEIKHRTQIDPLYYIKYGPFVVATVRPEPMFADTAIAVHPKDERYQQYIGKEVEVDLLWGKRKLPVIADPSIDPEFGTGAVKVTPAHDPNDWELAQKHNLDVIPAIGTDGRLLEGGGRYAGMKADEARQAIVHDLEERGLIDHIDMNYSHAVAVHDRDGEQIEPLVTEQWWLKVKPLVEPAIKALKSGEIEIVPTRFAKTAIAWLENLRDWNISRQDWWGIRIPIYYNATGDTSKPEYIFATSDSEAEKVYGKNGYEAEVDIFDTWFSSSQWPFATLMSTGDFDQFYPTSVMETGRDILFLWVTRMIMLGLYRTGKIPFKTVYLHGLVQDAHGKKMSKSRGNVINPLEMTGKYGTDALRLALTIGITPGQDGALSEEKIAGYRNFCNKLWNVARFTKSKVSDDFSPAAPSLESPAAPSLESPADHWMATQLNVAIQSVSEDMQKYRFSEAGQTLYSLLWDDFADRYIEASKQTSNAEFLTYALDTILKLLHPFAPFVTEAIWQELGWHTSLLISENWPNLTLKPDVTLAQQFQIEVIDILARADIEKKQATLEREIATKQNLVTLTETKLANQDFVSRAPKNVVNQQKQILTETKAQIKQFEDELEKLTS